MAKNRSTLSDRHHTVSRFLLKNFAIPGKPGKIYIYEKEEFFNRPNPREGTINNVAQRPGFNTLTRTDKKSKTDVLEKYLGTIETPASEIIERLNSKDEIKLSIDERSIIAAYVGILIANTPWNRQIQAEWLDNPKEVLQAWQEQRESLIDGFIEKRPELVEARTRITYSSDNPEKVLDYIRNNKKTVFALTSIGNASAFAAILAQRRFKLCVSPRQSFFVISDNPVSSIPTGRSGYGWRRGFINYPIVLPISPRKCLYLVDHGVFDNVDLLTPLQVDTVNGYTAYFAQRIRFFAWFRRRRTLK